MEPSFETLQKVTIYTTRTDSIRELTKLIKWCGKPKNLGVNNRPEFIAYA